jgi:hypothetical protein
MFGPLLLVMVAAFYLRHAPRELCHLWRFHKKRWLKYWTQRRHFRCAVEMVIATVGGLIIVSPIFYYLVAAVPGIGLKHFT